MRFFTTPAFERSLKALDKVRRKRAVETLETFIKSVEAHEGTPGLGLKQLRHGIWEIRSGLTDRILLRRYKDALQFIIIGTHDEIRRHLRNL